jgi:tRNA pseudouridine38-40 synthase
MPRYKLTIEYDGGPFAGWQAQGSAPTVQARLAEAVAAFCGEEVTVFGAGRTDAGVHARGQVAHLDLARAWDPDTVRDALNQHLKPDPVTVLDAAVAADDFDARFSAVMRTYEYVILSRRARPALLRGRAWHVAVPLDAEAMHAAAQVLVGRHDFTTFRSAQCQAASPVKTLAAIAVARNGELISVTCRARSFLHRQVRSMVGSLKLVGEGRWPHAAIAEALAARDRSACGAVAPAEGLYLVRVDYADGRGPARSLAAPA